VAFVSFVSWCFSFLLSGGSFHEGLQEDSSVLVCLLPRLCSWKMLVFAGERIDEGLLWISLSLCTWWRALMDLFKFVYFIEAHTIPNTFRCVWKSSCTETRFCLFQMVFWNKSLGLGFWVLLWLCMHRSYVFATGYSPLKWKSWFSVIKLEGAGEHGTNDAIQELNPDENAYTLVA
jgi:hypothetical protein